MSELGNWRAGKNLLVSAILAGAALAGKFIMNKADEKESENVVLETKGYKLTKKK